MAAEDDNFFSRWSRRKAQVRSGDPLPAEPPPVARAAPSAAVPAAGVAPAPGTPGAEPAAPRPPPTLDDVAQLTPESDFKAFVARGVSPEVRNAAVKKLFADPHFNVMDGLDIYIDDYSKPSPLSAAMMAKMVGAQFLKLVDDPNEPKPTAPLASSTSAAEPVGEAAVPDERETDTDAPGPAQADASPATKPLPPTHDDHADLQLQPDHAPEREGAGRGTG
jgi:hypothetical protein